MLACLHTGHRGFGQRLRFIQQNLGRFILTRIDLTGQQHSAVLGQIGAALLEQRAQEEETDLLRAFELAARQLQSGKAQKKVLVVAHSALSTVSPLALQDEDLTDLDAETVENLRAGLPDLTGVQHVEWYFLGDTAGEQEALSNAQKQSLKNFWEAYLKAAGVEEVNFRTDIPTQGEVENAPYVSVALTNSSFFA